MVVDVSAWTVIRPEEGGQDERKVWLTEDPNADRDQWWLWKPLKPTDQGATRTNDAAEVVTHHLAEAMNLPSAPCNYAERDGERGVISRNVAPHLYEMAPGEAWGAIKGETYTVERILTVLRGMDGPPPHHASLTAGQVFAGYLVLDAWVGNTDRHEQNWAVIQPPGGAPYIAPTFDHGSALGSGMTDAGRAKREVPAFCARGKSRWFARRPLVDLAAEAVTKTGAHWWADRVAAVPEDVWTGILDEHGALSEVARTFMSDVLTFNQKRVSNACRP